MATDFFKNFPTTYYTANSSMSPVLVRDIFARLGILKTVLNTTSLFTPYELKPGQRLDSVAQDFYGDEKYLWVVVLSNQIFGFNDSYMTQDELLSFIYDKYSTLAFIANKTPAQYVASTVHHYEDITQLITQAAYYNSISRPDLAQKVMTYDGVIVDYTTFTGLSPSNSRTIYIQDFENQLNEQRRFIKLINQVYINDVGSQLNNILNSISNNRLS
jgi:hypothetical protein